jgi:hypothetical protein
LARALVAALPKPGFAGHAVVAAQKLQSVIHGRGIRRLGVRVNFDLTVVVSIGEQSAQYFKRARVFAGQNFF